MYHGVFSSDRLTTRTSRRTPITSCRYHSGKVSLSPLVNRIAFGAVDSSRLRAKSDGMNWPRAVVVVVVLGEQHARHEREQDRPDGDGRAAAQALAPCRAAHPTVSSTRPVAPSPIQSAKAKNEATYE